MNVSAWAIRKPTPSILLFILITVAGLVAFQGLGVQFMPDMDFPSVSVSASLPGAAPEQVEAEVARPIEDSIASISGVRHITTTINDGAANVMVEFAVEKNLSEAVTDVRDAVSRIRSMLPADLQEPVVARVDYAGLAVLTYAVVAPYMDEADLSWFVDDVIGKRLLKERGVAQIRRRGGVTREVRVELDPLRLQALQATAGEINTQLRYMQQEAPGGRGNLGGLEQTVRTLGTVSSAAELANLSIPLQDGRRIRLGDVAAVRDTIEERRELALLEDKPVVSFEVIRARGYDEAGTAERVRSAVAVLRQAHPHLQIIEVANTVDHSEAKYQVAMNMLYEGAVLAVLVVWLFLRDWRATFVSAVALPLSIIPTFIVISVFGYSLNILTLLAITLVIGILVDDAIVEVENIMRHLRSGKSPREAATDAADEIGLAVIATSLTLVAVFLPTAFMSGITGVFFRQFGVTAAAAVLFSLLVARLLTPMMAAYLLRPPPGSHRDEVGPIMRRYLDSVRWCLGHPATTLAGAGALFLGSLLLIRGLPLEYVTAHDPSTAIIVLEAPPGSTLAQTARLAGQARETLREIPEVDSVFTVIGAGQYTGNRVADMAAAEVRTAHLTVRLKADRARSLEQIQVAMREGFARIPGALLSIGRGLPGEKMSLMLAGDDPRTLRETALAVEAELRTLPGTGAVTSSASLRRPEIVIRPDTARASELGVTSAAIGQAVRVATTGDYNFNLPRLNLPGRQVFVRVLLDPAARSDPALVGQLRVLGANGAAVPLANIARIEVADGAAQIDRYDRQRYVNLSVDLQGRPVGDVLEDALALPSLRHLPPGVTLLLSGDLEGMTEMLDEFSLAMIAGVFCVYAVMVLLFHDFGQPLTVLAALPLASTGALGLMWLFGYALSMASLVGLLILIGIVTKNSILLVDYAIMARTRGMPRSEALIDACRKRARPIVMTTVAMGAGMMPIALGMEAENSFRAPMAVVVIGGLITSTLLSLVVVPVVFVVVDRIRNRLFSTLRASPTQVTAAASRE